MSGAQDLLKANLGLILTWILGIYFVLVAVLYFSIRFFYNRIWHRKELPAQDVNRTLIVTAHPDDEAMFFGPTILSLLKRGQVYLLCFSYGDYEGDGLRRKSELWKSCQALGIPAENITIMKHDKLKDNPRTRWPLAHLASYIRGHVISHGITTLVTFDGYGVSGHPNHIAIYRAIVDLMERRLLPTYCRVFTLISVNILRKYVPGLFDVPLSYYFNKFVIVADGKARGAIMGAMECHESQMLWFRRLYVIFSRYLLVNTFKEISHLPPPASQQRKKYD